MSTAAVVVLCPWGKTLKTSTTTTTTRSFIVNGLFHSPLQKRRIGNDCWHFHQLFHHLRETRPHQTLRNTVSGDFGTAMTCSLIGRSRARKNSSTVSTICGTRASRVCTTGQTSAMCTTCLTNTPLLASDLRQRCWQASTCPGCFLASQGVVPNLLHLLPLPQDSNVR